MLKQLIEGSEYVYDRLYGHELFHEEWLSFIIDALNDQKFQFKFLYLNEEMRVNAEDVDVTWFEKLKHVNGLYSIKFAKKAYNNLRFLVMRTRINEENVIIFLDGFYEKSDKNSVKGYTKYTSKESKAITRMNQCKECLKGELKNGR